MQKWSILSSNFNELTIEDNASEIISNISNFETDLNYLYTAVNDAYPATIVDMVPQFYSMLITVLRLRLGSQP